MVDRGSARLFFALVPDSRTRQRIVDRQRAIAVRGRPVTASRLHATLAFLGSQPRDRISELRALGAELDLPPVTVCLDRAGAFGRAGVAWIGAGHPPAALLEFQSSLVSRLAAAEFRTDRRPWTLHITLYRDLRSRLRRMDIEPVGWRLTGFELVESVTRAEGPLYRTCARWPARGDAQPRGGA